MTTRICACCGRSFNPRPQVPNQAFCSAPPCQRERRLRWQREKLQTDPDYRYNKSRSQRAWLDRNPDYWRKYREGNADYAERNCAEQQANFTQTDALVLAGVYRIRSIVVADVAKSDAWIVEIAPVCFDCPCKKDACKDRT